MNSCMKQVLLILFVSLVLQEDVSSGASVKRSNSSITSSSTPTSTTTPQTATTLKSLKNESINGTKVTEKNAENGGLPRGDDDPSGMLKRSLFVAIGLSAFVAIYFIVRWIKTKGRRKAKKYGVIHGTGEMEPLDKHIDEDEEDMAVFDVKDAKRPR